MPRKDILAPPDWQEVRDLFDRCYPLDAAARKLLLEEATQGRPELRQEVESLLAKSHISDHDLGRPFIRQLAATPTAAVKPFQPQRFGKYSLFHRLGRGGMAEVFLAKMAGPSGFERLVAIKRILPEFAEDAEIRKMFEYEAKLSARLAHANIVHLYDFGDYDGACLLAMEYVNGFNLVQILERAKERGVKIPLVIAVYIAARVADGLDYAHQRRDEITGKLLGIIHRDITPKNVMISLTGETKIVDFGIAKAQDRTHFTRTGTIRGTLGFLSPEIIDGNTVDARSDIFSASAVLYELIAGTPLFIAPDAVSLFAQIRDSDRTSRRVKALDVDDRIKAILAKGLAISPEERYATAGKLRNDLDVWLANHPASDIKERTGSFVTLLHPDEVSERRKIIEQMETVSPLHSPPSSASRQQGERAKIVEPIPVNVRRLPRWMIEASLVVLLGFIALSMLLNMPGSRVPAGAIPDTPKSTTNTSSFSDACASDAVKYCPNLYKGVLVKCLTGKDKMISESCREAVRARKFRFQ